MRKNILLSIFYFLFILVLIFIFIKSIITGYDKETWHIAEFLINYQGGFVRRGLLGEILLSIYNVTGLSPYFLILFSCAFAYFALVFFFIKSFFKNGYPIFILPFIFFLGNPILHDFWVRKDVLITLLFISIIYFSIKKSNLYLILVNLLLMTGLLIHEAIGFFCFPVLLLILAKRKIFLDKKESSSIKSIILSFSQLLPSVITFFSVLYYKGSEKIARMIWESWKPVIFPIQNNGDELPGAINMLAWSLKDGLILAANIFEIFDFGIYAPLAWLIILLLIYYLLTNTDKLNVKILNYKPDKNFNKTNISNILLLQLLSVFPLFVIGCDYGRWVFFWVVSSFSIIILIPDETLSVIFPSFISEISSKFNSILDSFLSKSRGFIFLLCLIIGFPPYGWGILPCISKSAIIIVLGFLSNIIYIMTHYITDLLLSILKNN